MIAAVLAEKFISKICESVSSTLNDSQSLPNLRFYKGGNKSLPPTVYMGTGISNRLREEDKVTNHFSRVTDILNHIAMITYLILGFYTIISSLRLKATQRAFHHSVLATQATCIAVYAATIAGVGYLKENSDKPLLFHHDEYIGHGFLQIVALPIVVYMVNITAGVFTCQGRFIVICTAFSGIYGSLGLYLPPYWCTAMLSVLSVMTIMPYLYGLLWLWHNNVEAAPARVRKKVICTNNIQLSTILLVSVVMVMDCLVGRVSADVENAAYVLFDLVVYGLTPVILISDPEVIKDVYSREDFIRTTNRISSERSTE